MKLTNYSPTFRNVLFQEVVKERTDSGLYLPTKDMKLEVTADLFENIKTQFDGSQAKLGDYRVIKIGKDCSEVKPDDIIVLMTGINPTKIELDGCIYLQVMEQQIIGYDRI